MIYGVTVWLAKEVFQAVFFPSFTQIMIGRQQLLFDFDRLCRFTFFGYSEKYEKVLLLDVILLKIKKSKKRYIYELPLT